MNFKFEQSGKIISSTYALVPPTVYRNETVSQLDEAGKLSIGAGNNGKVYDMNLDGPSTPAVINGTNNTSMIEANVSVNAYTAPSGTDEEIEIEIWNTSSVDGTATGSLAAGSFRVTKFRLLGGARTIPIMINRWGTGRFKMAVNAAGANKTYQIDAKIIWITPDIS